jgi:hypothetical protein
VILYHGSSAPVEKPHLSYSRESTDFGRGFYVTPLREQAETWARRFLLNSGSGVVTSYDFLRPADPFPPEIRLLEFNTHTQKWLDFIASCRLGKPIDGEFDLIIGGVANDKVFDTLTLYFDGTLSAREAIRRLRYNKPNFQYCFKTQQIIDKYLIFREAEALA